MLFQAVIKYLSSSKFFKILSKRLKVHSGGGKSGRTVPSRSGGTFKAWLPDHCIFGAKTLTVLFVAFCICLLFSLFT